MLYVNLEINILYFKKSCILFLLKKILKGRYWKTEYIYFETSFIVTLILKETFPIKISFVNYIDQQNSISNNHIY